MARQKSEIPRRPAEPLATRHVFLDTQVYRGLGHNPANPAMKLLKQQVGAHRLVLHTTDITLLEVKRQLRERVASHQRDLTKIEKDLVRWRKAAPKAAPSKAVTLDADALAAELFKQFERFLVRECDVVVHRALNVSPAVVFERYFDRKAPFDGEDSKEFPDGFVMQALSAACEEQGERMYVVTEDRAMLRAVEVDDHLVPLRDIQQVLARAAADLDAAGEAIADAALDEPVFDQTFEDLLRSQMQDIAFVYVGELAEGEAYGGTLVGITELRDWSVVGLSETRLSLILEASVTVRVEIQFEDRDGAMYDREDDRWVGAESASTEIDNDIDLEVLVEINRLDGAVVGGKVLTSEVSIYGPSDYDYL